MGVWVEEVEEVEEGHEANRGTQSNRGEGGGGRARLHLLLVFVLHMCAGRGAGTTSPPCTEQVPPPLRKAGGPRVHS